MSSQAYDQIQFTVDLPADAALFINGQPTTQTGPERVLIYSAVNLVDGQPYQYTFRADEAVGGQTLSQSQTVTIYRGQSVKLAFDFPAVQ